MNKLKSISDYHITHLAAWLFILGLSVVTLIYFKNFLQPFVLALVVWYLIYEVKRLIGFIRIRGREIPKWLQAIISFIAIMAILTAIFSIVRYNLELIITKSPQYIINAKDLLSKLSNFEQFDEINKALQERLNFNSVRPILSTVLDTFTSVAGDLFMIVVYVIFLLVEEKFFQNKVKTIFKSEENYQSFKEIWKKLSASVRTYFSIKTAMSLLTGVLSYIVLLFLQVDFPVLWAFLIFLFNYVPYVGSLIATLLPALFAIFQFQSFWPFLWVLLSVESIQILVGNFIEPRVTGKVLNLSPLGVILALSFWGIIWGVLGMVISVPITSISVIVMSYFPNTRFAAIWLSETGEVGDLPHMEDD